MIDPLSYQMGKTSAMLKMETEWAEPFWAVMSRCARALGRLDPKIAFVHSSSVLPRRQNEGREGPRSVAKLNYRYCGA
jgi:hypothetical protein